MRYLERARWFVMTGVEKAITGSGNVKNDRIYGERTKDREDGRLNVGRADG